MADIALAALAVLVGENDLAVRAVVDQRLVPEDKAVIKEFEEDPLGPLVVILPGCIYGSGPVKREADAFKLIGKLRDIGIGDHPGMCIGLDSVVLSGQTERVVADREQNVIALHPALSGQHFHAAVSLDVADVHTGSAGIGELDQSVKLGLVAEILRFEEPFIFPFLLPFGFNLLKIVFHEMQLLYFFSFPDAILFPPE